MAGKEEIPVVDKMNAIGDIKVAKFDINKRYTKPHKHNKYLEIVFFTQGSGYHNLGLNNYRIEPPVLFFVNKNQVHHWEIATKPRGFVVIIKETYLKKVSDKTITSQLLQLNEIDILQVPTGKTEHLDYLFKALCSEYEQKNPNPEIFEGILKVILMNLIDFKGQTNNHKQDVKLLFLNLIATDLKVHVGHYAEKLYMTPQNLNNLCKRSFQQTASQVISYYVLKEVKSLLLYTDLSISDIAHKLSFQDTSNFIKYFKRHTGITPLQFRKTGQVL
ncbi:AraC-like ligand binding domain-containing protein [Zhouia amylolytica]|uniref:AraC-like ligand binding domain-containing protein n=1 Tax=Zhouia amylolytica TaxID=376730 RepID=A0A1I6UMW0_9FLAO|nr:helix-turn-helix domain-containing protein [Zhouia amylolytica]SFT02806.1 AraC-like ligand binding domain-containing protein [Zhouia amylolytica]